MFGRYVHKCVIPGNLDDNYIPFEEKSAHSFYEISGGKIRTIDDLLKYGVDPDFFEKPNLPSGCTETRDEFERCTKWYDSTVRQIKDIGLKDSGKSDADKFKSFKKFVEMRSHILTDHGRQYMPEDLKPMLYIFNYINNYEVKKKAIHNTKAKAFLANIKSVYSETFTEYFINTQNSKLINEKKADITTYGDPNDKTKEKINSFILSVLKTKKGYNDLCKLFRYFEFYSFIFTGLKGLGYYYFRNIYKAFKIYGTYRDEYTDSISAEEIVVWDPSLVQVTDIKDIGEAGKDDPNFNKWVGQTKNMQGVKTSIDGKDASKKFKSEEPTSYNSKNVFKRKRGY